MLIYSVISSLDLYCDIDLYFVFLHFILFVVYVLLIVIFYIVYSSHFV